MASFFLVKGIAILLIESSIIIENSLKVIEEKQPCGLNKDQPSVEDIFISLQ